MSASADRNLLFGIVALQFDFITREQLIAGMSAWVLAKHRPLADLLQEAGALPPSRRQLLEPLVAEHIQQHNNDPQQSLATVSSLGSVKAELQKIDDQVLQASLTVVSANMHTADESIDPFATIAAGQSSSAGLRFRVLRPHAEGGLGVVQVANDEELNREVALKEIKLKYAGDLNSRVRFVREAEITGGLEHPNIVPVYGLGSYADGRPFYAMRFIRGKSLAEAIKQFHEPAETEKEGSIRNLELRRLLQRFIDVCEAIHYAHSRGVLHRDLKPGNIMLGRHGETLVVDWGLAKSLAEKLDAEPLLANQETVSISDESPLKPSSQASDVPTQMDAVLGTPGYMSPEQALGYIDLLGPASDVFSLGATLYHLLTGRPPYVGSDGVPVLKLAQEANYPRPREVNPEVARSLEAICLKAMSMTREDRYVTAKLLAEDVEKYLGDEPVTAAPDTIQQRVFRMMRRHRGIVATILVALSFIAFCGICVSFALNRLARRETAQRRVAETLAEEKAVLATSESDARARAETAKSAAVVRQLQAEASRILAQSRIEYEHRPVSSALLSVEAAELLRENSLEPNVELLAQLHSSLSQLQGRLLSRGPGPFDSLKLIVIPTTPPLLAAADEYLIRTWQCGVDGPRNPIASTFATDGRVLLCDRRGDSNSLGIVTDQGAVHLLQFAPNGSISQNKTLHFPQPVKFAHFSRSGQWLAAALEPAGLALIDLQTEDVHRVDVNAAAGYEAGSCAVVGIDPLDRWAIFSVPREDDEHLYRLMVFDLKMRDSPIWSLPGTHSRRGGEGHSWDFSWSQDGTRFATADTDGLCRLWSVEADLLTKEPALSFPGVDGCTNAIKLSPDGGLVFHHGCNGMSVFATDEKGTAVAHSQSLQGYGPEFSPDGRWIFIGDAGSRQVHCWRTDEIFLKSSPHISLALPTTCSSPILKVSADSTQLICHDLLQRFVVAWRIRGDELDPNPVPWLGQQEYVADVAIAPDSTWGVAGGGDEIRVWQQTSPVEDSANAVAISPDGRWAATGGQMGAVQLLQFDPERNEPRVASRKIHDGQVFEVSFSPNSRWLITSGLDQKVQLYDLSTEAGIALNTTKTLSEGLVYRHKHHPSSKSVVLLRPDDAMIASLSDDPPQKPATVKLDELNLNREAVFCHEGSDRIGFVLVAPEPLIRRWSPAEGQLTDLLLPLVVPEKCSIQVYSTEGRYAILGAYSEENAACLRWWLFDIEKLLSDEPGVSPAVVIDNVGTMRTITQSPDGRHAAIGGSDGSVVLYDLKPGMTPGFTATRLSPPEGSFIADSLRFSPDGRWLAAGPQSHDVRLWDLHSASPAHSLQFLRGHEHNVSDLLFSTDGRWLATSSLDQHVRLWDLSQAPGQAVGASVRYVSNPFSLQLLRFANDNRLFFRGEAWNLDVIDLDVPRLVAAVNDRAGRKLRFDEWNRFQLWSSRIPLDNPEEWGRAVADLARSHEKANYAKAIRDAAETISQQRLGTHWEQQLYFAAVCSNDAGLPPAKIMELANSIAQQDPLSGFGMRIRGAAHYRNKEYDLAQQAFEQSATRGWPPQSWDFCFQAMIASRCGNMTHANTLLKLAVDWEQKHGVAYVERLQLGLLMKETRMLIEGK